MGEVKDGNHSFVNFEDILHFWGQKRPNQIALEQDGRITTYAQLDLSTRRIVSWMASKNIRKGDRIAWFGKNSDLYCQLYLAAARIGVVMVPVGWRLAPPEVSYILRDTGAKIVFAGEGFSNSALQIASKLESNPIVVSDQEARLLVAESDAAIIERIENTDPVLQLYTSGTTGNPKGVMLSNENLHGLRNPGNEAGLPWNFYEGDECMLVAMPCAHIGGTGLINIAVANGIRTLIQAEFSPEGVLEAIENGATHLFLVPAALQMVIQHPNAKDTDFSGLQYLMYGAAPMPLELLKEAVRTMPNAGFIQAYGMTETSGTISILPPSDHDIAGNERMRSAGKALPGVSIQIRNSENKEIPRGEIGEVCILSPSNTAGYWQLPEASRKTIDRDGWLHTGDAAIMDRDGYIYIQDRIKDMIISGGENVYPAEVESAMYGHPAILEVAIIGVPSQKWGEEVKACIVCKPGCEIDAEDIINYTRERVAAYKAPKSIDFIPEMPRNPSGKILRRELRATYWKGQERQVS
jgi:acyl-CoA synthetase (AMP-forming)/AMP-acid ligase II